MNLPGQAHRRLALTFERAILVVAMMLHPAALMAHDSGMVYVRLERNTAAGTLALQATVECAANPLVANPAAAREVLTTLFDLQGASAAGQGGPAPTPPAWSLGTPQWSEQTAWTDDSVPVTVLSAGEDSMEHRWVTARWALHPPQDEPVFLHIAPGTKLAAVLWEVDPSHPVPEGGTRWQILMPGDRSFRLNAIDNTIPLPVSGVQSAPTARKPHLPWLAMATGAFTFLAVFVFVAIIRLAGSKPKAASLQGNPQSPTSSAA